MPYTLAHPVAVWPLKKARLFSAPALIIGAMAPDFEFVFRLRPTNVYGHSALGLFWFCLPVGLAVLWIYRRYWRAQLKRFFPQLTADTSAPARDALSILAGALSHVGWDAFTHGDRWGAALLPILRVRVALPFGYSMLVHNILQHLSTVTGLFLLAFLIARGALSKDPLWWRRSGFGLAALGSGLAIVAMALTWPTLRAEGHVGFMVMAANMFTILLAVALSAASLLEGIRASGRSA